tara:strand:- start:322 stop:594 length:273 start_codon:yes stop_codon:yes gene_type:complete
MDDLAYRQLEEQKIYKVNQARIREDILNIVHGNIRYADPFDRVNLEKGKKVGVKGFTTQSAEEVLDDIICDLTALQDETRIESSFQSAQL